MTIISNLKRIGEEKMSRKIDKVFNKSKRIQINDDSKIVIMSDCHRGAGDNYDNFIKNKNIYIIALIHYYNKGFTYIELGDGDEMWEVKNYEDIIDVHLDAFKQLKKFHDSGRLMMVYGNHDISKKYPEVLEKYFYKYYNNSLEQDITLLDGLNVDESLVLDYKEHDIFLIHGHQADFLNSTIWRFSRFLVRNVWRVLEHIGVKDFTSAAKNYQVARLTEKKLTKWSNKNNKILIAGHTHRPIFPKKGQGLYFNDGSCIHPNGITCIEIEKGNITLVRWEFKQNDDKLISAERNVLDGNEPIINFFK